jgi:hypothetical protein
VRVAIPLIFLFFIFLSPLGERLGEGVNAPASPASPNLSPKGRGGWESVL